MCVDWGVSIRRACGAICFGTSTYHYKSRRTDKAAVERRIKEIAETRVRYGYRRVHVLLHREGWIINMKRTRRIYNELGLQLRNKHPKRRVTATLREDRHEAAGPNDLWTIIARQAMRSIAERGFCSRPARSWQEATDSDRRGHSFPVVSRCRSTVQLSGRRCRSNTRKGLRQDRPPEDDQGRQRPMSGKSGRLGQQVIWHPVSRTP